LVGLEAALEAASGHRKNKKCTPRARCRARANNAGAIKAPGNIAHLDKKLPAERA
jgi:hypothetical protein